MIQTTDFIDIEKELNQSFQDYLTKLNPQIQPESLSVKRFKGGYSNLTYLITSNDGQFVLRRPPHGADVKGGHNMEREFKILSVLRKHFDQAPKTISYCDDLSILGCPFYLMEKIDGPIIRGKDFFENPSENLLKGVADQWINRLVELHSIPITEELKKDFNYKPGYVSRQIEGWSKRYLKAQTSEVQAIENLMSWLSQNIPNNETIALIHNDYKYDNIVFKDDSFGEITAILDWEMATIGDPLMDLGSSLAYWVNYDDPFFTQALSVLPTNIPGNYKRGELLEKYLDQSNLEVEDFTFYYAYGLFKIAVIVQQIFFRYENGLTRDQRFAHFDKYAEVFCNMALKAIEKNQIDNQFS
ncbi:MAG: phosphotransferase family protein [Flavobacteriales bacterium]|nr:phosphotransferase family protein [Flavobacteriales bacterium]